MKKGLGPSSAAARHSFHRGDGGHELESVVHVPEVLADALSLLLDEVGVVARDDDRALAAGLVGPREADPDGGIKDAVHFFDGVDHLVEGLGGFDAGRGLFAGQQDGDVDEGLDGLGLPV